MASEIRVNSLTNRSGLSTVSITDTGAVVAGLVTATTFSGPLTGAVTGNVTGDLTGNITGNVTGNLTGNVTGTATTATALSGSPSITVTDITATGNVSIGGTLTYEDVTNIDSVGIVTAQSDVHVGAGLSVVGITTTQSDVLVGRNLSVTSGISTVKSLDYAAIDSTISDTAVDVFIYDTSKDSDGGAWRKRTQHTSWYNETLNTATRGSRREFPSVAVIVTETDRVTIYDGDDPDLPMWMVFLSGPDSSNERLLRYATNDASEMLNAILCVATSDTLAYISFIDEYHRLYHTDAEYYFPERTGIVDRNTIIGEPAGPLDGGYGLPSADTNDVAMTVLPNAPIDSATGLPKPTIAVATENGLGVIKDDGTVVDIRGNHGGNYNQTIFVDFDSKTNAIISGFDYGAGNTDQIYKLAVFPIPSTDVTDDNTLHGYQHHYRRIQTGGNATIPKLAGNYITDAISVGGDGRYAIQTTASGSYPTALNIIQEEPGTDGSSTTYPSNSRVAYATTSYNTGWMHGDIKGAFLSDTDTTNATDSNVVTNGTFDSNTSSWSGDSGASVSWDSGGFASVNYGGGANDNTFAIQQTGILVSGAKYRITGRVQPSMSGSYEFRVRAGGSGTQWSITSGLTNGQWYSFDTGIITADGTKLEIGSHGGTITNFYLDDVYVWKLEEEDRSVNNTGLEVHGTITKSAVATGAELVAYSGFQHTNPDNYLKQPYNSDLDFGTGDFSVTWWQYTTGDITSSEYVYDRQGGNGNRHAVYYTTANSGSLAFYTVSGSASELVATGINSYKDGWACYTVSRRSSGLMEIYVNGELKQSNTLTVRNLTNTSAELFIGIRHSLNTDAATQAKFALMRFSKSIPSPEQIKKIYEDEKVLFQENAKATLYGSSDAVTALAYDDDTDLLHVGTSSGRSDFQGLRRINNTTTAVTTAITAQNEFIIEQ